MATLPSLIILVIFTFFFLTKMNSVYEDAEELYYHRLYTINSNLVNADRDFYQALQASTKQYNMESSNSSALTPEVTQQNVDDYNENKQQVIDEMTAACDVAELDADLWTGTKSEDGRTFEEVAAEFKVDYDAWLASYDPAGGRVAESQFIEHSATFSKAREALNVMQEITEAWAEKENKKIEADLHRTEIVSIVAFIIVAAGMSLFAIYVMRLIGNGIRDVYGKLVNLSHYDLSQELLVVDSTDELGQMKKAFNDTQEALKNIVSTLQTTSGGLMTASNIMNTSTQTTSSGSDDVSSAASELANASTTMAQDVTDISMNMETLEQIMQESGQAASDLAEASASIGEATNEGSRIVEDLSEVNTKSLDEFNGIFEGIENIKTSVGKIGEASELIASIAAQTNLLSLNASIEAARAGEAGRGFAVVADEIRKLSDESKENVDSINAIIDELAAVTSSAAEKSDTVKEYVDKQNKAVEQTKDSFASIVDAVHTAEEAIERLEGCVQNLDTKTKEISSSVENLSALSQENAATAEELSATSDTVTSSVADLMSQQTNVVTSSSDLSEIVGRFQMEEASFAAEEKLAEEA